MQKVSIIVPVYNVGKYLGRCIESIQKQTLTDWELILVDDCSSDNSMDVIQSYAKNDNRIIIKRHDVNHGPMIARRWGDEIANGEYITYCDGDDILPENALQLLYNAAKNTGADIVSGNYTYVTTKGKRIDCVSKLKEGCDSEGLLKALLKYEMQHILCSKLFKSELVKNHDYRVIDHMTNAEDGYLFYQMIPYAKSVVQINDIVYYYMQNLDSSSQRRYTDNAIENILLMNSFRVSLIDNYPNLRKEIVCFVSDVLNELIIKGYNENGLLQKLMEKYKLQDYSSDWTIITTHTLTNSIKLLLRKYVLRR